MTANASIQFRSNCITKGFQDGPKPSTGIQVDEVPDNPREDTDSR